MVYLEIKKCSLGYLRLAVAAGVFVEFVGAACLLIRASISVEIVEPWVASY